MNEKNKNAKKKSSFPWALLILLLPLLSRMKSGDLPPTVMAAAAVVIVCFILLGLGLSKAGAKKTQQSPRPAARTTPSIELHRPAPSMPRKGAQQSFPKPDPYCVSCELSGEDHFVRDRQRRLAQLDEWLKNGIVGKEEYLVLKRRFEHDE